MDININSNENSFKFSKKVTKFKSGTNSPYTVPKTLAVTNKCTIAVSSTECVISPYPNFVGTHQIIVTYEDKTTEVININFKLKAVEVIPTQPVEPPVTPSPTPTPSPSTGITSKFIGTIGNSAKLGYGPTQFKGLRSPVAAVEIGDYLYVATGYPEGNSPIFKTKVGEFNERIEVDKPAHNGFVMEPVNLLKYGNKLVMVGFDPAANELDGSYSSKLYCGVVVYENDEQVVFQYGRPFRCTFQDSSAPYKSMIGIIQRPVKILKSEIQEDSLIIYYSDSKSTCKHIINLISGINTSISVIETSISLQTIHETCSVDNAFFKCRGLIVAQAQNNVISTNYKYLPYDFTNNEYKTNCHEGKDYIYLCDSGNSRILIYRKSTFAFVASIDWVPMNYNFGLDINYPTRHFITGIEYHFNYNTYSWEKIKNWNVGLSKEYLPSNNRYNFLNQVVTTPTGTFGLIDKVVKDGDQDLRYPTLFKFTDAGLVKIKEFDVFANVYIDKNGNEYVWETPLNVGSYATQYRNGIVHQKVLIEANSALSMENAIHCVTDNGYTIIFNPNKDHKQFHLSWVKGNKVVFNAMPSIVGKDGIYPPGDAFDIGNGVEYAGAPRVYCVGNKVFVIYIGEFHGGAGNQTLLGFVYEDGKLLYRFGKTSKEAMATGITENPPEFAGNARAGQCTFINGKYYMFTNCEHTGRIPCFEISNLK